ncbi:low molecular weight protein-tyrosine-phosphatase [Streptomyces sp. WMMB 322]|uniref:low molecular weight protein-tyrosine-phosphatase n=1 Tax=Streptomyces sp. WMMB 322 TaxID=1286821 RepID=UPI0006E1F803|nr:low molecular weight protein-tyrosine-phosphatase [Streptomyces sp. WMMB 322]SCK14338.1 protein tyrosine phosphatase [Streptomyces sp. WMMB 322]
MDTFRVCFVCTGNICRSPMAEAVLRAHVTEAGLEDRITVSSAGTGGWHVGEPADRRTTGTLEAAGYELAHRARQFEPGWFGEHDLVVALDEGHERELRAMARTPDDVAKVRLLRSYDPAASAGIPPGPSGGTGVNDRFGLDVPDPYYGGADGFDEVLRLIEAAVPGVLAEAAAALEERLAGAAGGHHGEETS